MMERYLFGLRMNIPTNNAVYTKILCFSQTAHIEEISRMSPNKPEFIGPNNPIKFKPPNIKLPGKLKGFITILGLLLIVGVVALRTCFTYIEPHELGIKQVKIGVGQGMKEKVYGPGLVFVKPFMDVIHRFPNHIQVLDLTGNNAANIQTSDGFFVDVEATVLYRISDPYLLIQELGTGQNYISQGIAPKAIPYLKESLGELTTEEFYNSHMRVEKAEQARDLLNTEMSSKGIEVEHVLVRYFEYSEEIQSNIEDKKLQDQLVFKNQSESRAATEFAQITKIKEEGEANVLVTLQEGEAYKVTKEAERDLYVRSKKAEADLLVQLAEAKSTELKNEAMRALGADRAVALEMAEVLAGLDVVILPVGGEGGMNPLDLTSMTKLFGVEGETNNDF
jgi:regulator of protease activity HflC (stomatin/prohibitin superfamily)